MKVSYTPQEFLTIRNNKVSIEPTFYKFQIKVESHSRLDDQVYVNHINIPMENISDLITELKKLEREYKSYKIVDDMLKEFDKEMSLI